MKRFRDREDAARQLAQEFEGITLHDPLILGIPRGGVVTAVMLARELDADVDVALSRKLRHPSQPELAIGAVSEDGSYFIQERFRGADLGEEYLERERQQRMAELQRRRKMFQDVRPPAEIEGRTVILTDDGIATGSTMFAALELVKHKRPRDTIVAVPVAPRRRFEQFRGECDQALAVMLPDDFAAIGQFYEEFEQVDDDEVCKVLREFIASRNPTR